MKLRDRRDISRVAGAPSALGKIIFRRWEPILAEGFDLAVVGAGIVGLAHAWAAVRIGKKVVVIERDAQANGASIRNFGFITVTGQERFETWQRAHRSARLWRKIAPLAQIPVLQEGLILMMRRNESLDVARAFLATEMGEGCKILTAATLGQSYPMLAKSGTLGALLSPHEVRVESRAAIPALRAYLSETFGVEFRTSTAVTEVTPPVIKTSRGSVRAEAVIVCPGDDLVTLFPERIAAYHVQRCRLSMMRLANPGFVLPAPLMSDLGLVRYRGYAALPEAQALTSRLIVEQSEFLSHGIHLIVTQSADGTLVVGDSHHYADTPDPFASQRVDELILQEFADALGFAPPPVIERWVGTYSSAPDRTMFVDAPAPEIRLVMVTSGTGASTAFAIGEDVIGQLYNIAMGEVA
jgi:FAD dependent oxidoreductase TIGR03364